MILKLLALSNDEPETGMALVFKVDVSSLFFHSGTETEKFNNLLFSLSKMLFSLVQEQMHKLTMGNKYKEDNKFSYLFLSTFLHMSDSFSDVSSLRERRET